MAETVTKIHGLSFRLVEILTSYCSELGVDLFERVEIRSGIALRQPGGAAGIDA